MNKILRKIRKIFYLNQIRLGPRFGRLPYYRHTRSCCWRTPGAPPIFGFLNVHAMLFFKHFCYAYPTPTLGLRYAYATEVGKMCAFELFFNTSGYVLSGYRRFRKSLHSRQPLLLPLISHACPLLCGRACSRSKTKNHFTFRFLFLSFFFG